MKFFVLEPDGKCDKKMGSLSTLLTVLFSSEIALRPNKQLERSILQSLPNSTIPILFSINSQLTLLLEKTVRSGVLAAADISFDL